MTGEEMEGVTIKEEIEEEEEEEENPISFDHLSEGRQDTMDAEVKVEVSEKIASRDFIPSEIPITDGESTNSSEATGVIEAGSGSRRNVAKRGRAKRGSGKAGAAPQRESLRRVSRPVKRCCSAGECDGMADSDPDYHLNLDDDPDFNPVDKKNGCGSIEKLSTPSRRGVTMMGLQGSSTKRPYKPWRQRKGEGGDGLKKKWRQPKDKVETASARQTDDAGVLRLQTCTDLHPERGVKRKRVNLTVTQKLELIEKMEAGIPRKHLCKEYGVKTQTISDIRKSKGKLTEFARTYSVDGYRSKSGWVGTRKHMKVGAQKSLNEAMYKWCMQQKSCGNEVSPMTIRNACVQLSENLGIQFNASDGWLWRFRNRYGLRNLKECGESGSGSKNLKECGESGYGSKNLKECSESGYGQSNLKECGESGYGLRNLKECGESGYGSRNLKECGESGYGLRNLKECVESEGAECFQTTFNCFMGFMEKEGLRLSQAYNAGETDLFWRCLPKDTQTCKDEEVRVRLGKFGKERISALCCANADGNHRPKLVIVSEDAGPSALKNHMHSLPVHYYPSKNACFNAAIFSDWFHKHFVPEVRKFQEENLKIPPEDIKAVLLLANTPAHPSGDNLVSADGRIRVIYLPPNTTSLIQPMDQGVISACKRRYQQCFLNKLTVIVENEDNLENDTRWQRTLKNIKNYTVKSAIFNLANSWKGLEVSTLTDAWKKILTNVELKHDFEGFEATDLHCTSLPTWEKDVTLQNIQDWPEKGDSNPDCQMLSNKEIVATGFQDSNSEEEDTSRTLPKVSYVLSCLDVVLQFAEYTKNREISAQCGNLRILRKAIIKEQLQSCKQLNMVTVFKPVLSEM